MKIRELRKPPHHSLEPVSKLKPPSDSTLQRLELSLCASSEKRLFHAKGAKKKKT
jgi:hypothetical protein